MSWIRNVLNHKQLELEKVHTDDNGFDMLTKSLPREKIEACRLIVGLVPYDQEWENLLGQVCLSCGGWPIYVKPNKVHMIWAFLSFGVGFFENPKKDSLLGIQSEQSAIDDFERKKEE